MFLLMAHNYQPLTSAHHQGGDVHRAHHQHRQEADHRPQRQLQQQRAEGDHLQRVHLGSQEQGQGVSIFSKTRFFSKTQSSGF